MNSSAEEIAQVVSDIRDGRIKTLDVNVDSKETLKLTRELFELHKFMPGVIEIVDSTLLFEREVAKGKGIYLYEDHEIAAPWKYAMVGYRNQHGNVKVMASTVIDLKNDFTQMEWEESGNQWQPLNQEHRIDWPKIRWVYLVLVYIGGHSGSNQRIPTTGPCFGWQIAVTGEGQIQDIQWNAVSKTDPDDWSVCCSVLLRTLHFATATNVVLLEPERPRSERRRIARTGLSVRTIHVLPTGKTRQSRYDNTIKGTMPLTSVRGHFAKYGPKYGRGLLFGKYEGRFWIPAHAIGSKENGEIHHNYVLEP